MIERIEVLHSCKYLHRDLKPDNFVLENMTSPKIINLIDFGLSKKYAVLINLINRIQKEIISN